MQFPTNTKPLLWGAVAGAVACMIVGFSWGGWVAGGTARKDAATAAHDAVVVALAPICADRDEKGTVVPLDVKAGDRVLFGKWSGTEVKLDGEDLLIMAESDVMGVVDAAVAKKKAA